MRKNWTSFSSPQKASSPTANHRLQNITISYETYAKPAGVPPSDTCSPTSPLTADYTYQCSDNCNIGNLNANGYDITFAGTGTATITAGSQISNANWIRIDDVNNCLVTCSDTSIADCIDWS